MIEITINRIPYSLPQSWKEVTVSQFRDIVRHSEHINPVRLLSIFTGIDYDLLSDMDCSGFDNVFLLMDFIGESPNPEKWQRSKVIELNGLLIPVIKSIEKEKIGQKIIAQQVINEAAINQQSKIEIVSKLVACYYCPKLNASGLWIESEYEALQSEVDKMSVVEAYAEANFFLSKWKVFAPKNPILLPLNQPQTN